MDRILFLDVDGVLNPFRARTNLHGDWRKHSFDNGGRYWASAHLGTWMRTLQAQGVTIVWATTWVHHLEDLARYAELMGAPAGLDRIRFEPAASAASANESGKRAGVDDWLVAHSPLRDRRLVVWVDDDIGPQDRSFACQEGIVVFRPHPASGLAPAGLRRAITETLRCTPESKAQPGESTEIGGATL